LKQLPNRQATLKNITLRLPAIFNVYGNMMYRFFRCSFLFLLIFLNSACAIQWGGHRHIVSDVDFYLNIQAPDKRTKDNISFNKEETSITVLPKEVSIDVSHTINGVKRGLMISNADDHIVYNYQVAGRSAHYDAAAQAWFSEQIPRILRETGINANTRVTRLYNSVGTHGLFTEINKIDNDNIKGIYLAHTFNSITLNESETNTAIKLASSIESDYEFVNLIQTIIDKPLSNQNFIEVLALSNNIQSDFQLASLLKRFSKDALNNELVQVAFFEVSQSIQSDYELSELFSAQAENMYITDTSLQSLLQALRTIQSDYEMRRVLKALASDLSFKVYKPVLVELAGDLIQADYELSTFLIDIIHSSELTGELESALRRAVLNISSQHDKDNVLTKLNN
jgi:hypothetical protein